MLPCAGISMCRNQPKPQNTMSRNISWNINYIHMEKSCTLRSRGASHWSSSSSFFSPPVACPRRILSFPPLTSRSWKNCWAKRRRTKNPPSNCHVPSVGCCVVEQHRVEKQGPHGACFFLLDVIFSKEPVKFLPPRHTTSSIRARWCRKCTFFDKRAILWDDEHPRNRPLQEGLKFSLKITPIFHLIFKRRWRSEVLIIDVNRKLGAGFHWGTLKFYTKHWGWFKIWLAQHSFPILSCEKARNSIVENMMYICYTFIYLQDAFFCFYSDTVR